MERPSRMRLLVATTLCCLAAGWQSFATAQRPPRPYRLNAVDLKQRIIWGAECRAPEGQGLAFGGQDQDADDGRPHTRVLVDGQWLAIGAELRKANPLQPHYDRCWSLRGELKDSLAASRSIYFQGLPPDTEAKHVRQDVDSQLAKLKHGLARFDEELAAKSEDSYGKGQVAHARRYLTNATGLLDGLDEVELRVVLSKLHQAQIQLELAAQCLDAQPPARAMDCGTARISSDKSGQQSNTLVYDEKSKLYLLFGGDHLDYLTNDTWVFDPAVRRWFQRHPQGSPPPRANHRLTANGDGTVRLTGGYTYSSNTDYLGGQYVDLNDGAWTYDIAKNQWKSEADKQLVAPDSRVYRSGPFHPEFYFQDPQPNAAEFLTWLKEIPTNEWVPTNPPHLPRLNRDWGTARIDPDRDIMLRWSGGHSAHGGTDVLHYHFATNRWELPFPVEFPLGQLYSNTSYPNGLNFNLRPWMTGHTYQNYAYDPPSKMLIKAGRPRHFHIYDPDVGDWIGRGEKPAAMQYNSCFYTLTLTATPEGIVCWDKNGRVHRYQHDERRWIELELTGDKLPGAYVDNSSIVYDSKRNRALIVNTAGYGKPFGGQVWAINLKTNVVEKLTPQGHKLAHRFATIDKTCYDAQHDLMLFGTYLKDAGDHTPMPAYDCAGNRWVTINVKYETGTRSGNTTRAFPHTRSDALMFDARRKLIWGTNTNGQIYVLRPNAEQAELRPLK